VRLRVAILPLHQGLPHSPAHQPQETWPCPRLSSAELLPDTPETQREVCLGTLLEQALEDGVGTRFLLPSCPNSQA
jgi:hypothetical protein